MAFNNEAELKAALMKVALNAVSKVEKKVHEEFAGNMNQYYTEFIPAEYIRTGALYGSLEETPTRVSGNGAEAEVYFTVPSYETGTWSGDTVLDHALHRGSHGGYVDGTSIWNDSINSLGSIKGMLLAAVKEQL